MEVPIAIWDGVPDDIKLTLMSSSGEEDLTRAVNDFNQIKINRVIASFQELLGDSGKGLNWLIKYSHNIT